MLHKALGFPSSGSSGAQHSSLAPPTPPHDLEFDNDVEVLPPPEKPAPQLVSLDEEDPDQVWSLSSFKVSRQLLINNLNQVSSVSLLMTSSTALANEGIFELIVSL